MCDNKPSRLIIRMTGMTEKDQSRQPRCGDVRSTFSGGAISLPHSRPVTIAIGTLLILFGILGFLPVLGFWMIPLGVLVLSHDLAWARRRRRRLVVWWERRQRRNGSGET